jgi:hypothetical protein
MIISSDQLPDLWRTVREERAASFEKALTVLHSISEVDSACATRLLMVRSGRTAARALMQGGRGGVDVMSRRPVRTPAAARQRG